jgi:hypothetical protein
MRKAIATSLLLLLSILSFGQETEITVTYFDFGKYELRQQSKVTLDDLLDKVKIKDIVQIEIIGHTDGDGDDRFNLKLSQNRATSVRKYLVSKGISNDRITCEYFGESQPTATNENEDGKQKNRRVEIVISYKEKAKIIQTAIPETKEDVLLEKSGTKVLELSYSVNREYIQTFKVSANNKIVIKGEQGTTIRIPENAFVDEKYNLVTGEISIELVEIYTKSDMILNNIQTTSNGKLLETSGMIYIRAISKNVDVDLKKDEFYTIEFPTRNKQKDMNIFYGDTTSHNINWVQANSNFRSDYTYIENQKELNKYIFNSTEFGWINCDRFIYQTETTDLIVNTTDTLGVNFCLVFKSINSVMNVSDRNGVIKFYNVPVGQTADLIAFKRSSQKIFYASKTIEIKRNESIPITMSELTDKEFKERVKQFD